MSDSISKETSSDSHSNHNIHYVRQMLGELRSVAEGEKAEMLCYLIEMAFMEAGDIIETKKRSGDIGGVGPRA